MGTTQRLEVQGMTTPTSVLNDGETQLPTKSSSERGNGGGPPIERVTVNLSPMAAAALRLVAETTEVSKTDAINKALRFYGEVTELLSKGGAVYIREPDEKELERVRII